MSRPVGLPKMKDKFLSRSGLRVSAIALGGWLTYGGYVETDIALIYMKATFDIGINFFDFAKSYSSRGSERTVRAFNHLINTGKAFYWGTSEWNADEIATAWRYTEKLNPDGARDGAAAVEKEFEHLYEEVGLGLTIFSPLKLGILTGKYLDGIPEDSRLKTCNDPFVVDLSLRVGGEAWKKEMEMVARLKPVAQQLGITQASLAMAWVLSNKRVSSAITAVSRPEQIYESVRALNAIEKLTPEVLKEIDEILGNNPGVTIGRFG
ncbi:putative voltage-gated K channel beta subunit [Diplocarpon rosae]|nr:putative voltage-gated K channel beta subunit [Diplocarpon rosae]